MVPHLCFNKLSETTYFYKSCESLIVKVVIKVWIDFVNCQSFCKDESDCFSGNLLSFVDGPCGSIGKTIRYCISNYIITHKLSWESISFHLRTMISNKLIHALNFYHIRNISDYGLSLNIYLLLKSWKANKSNLKFRLLFSCFRKAFFSGWR